VTDDPSLVLLAGALLALAIVLVALSAPNRP